MKKVADLLAELSAFDPSLEVVIGDSEYEIIEVKLVDEDRRAPFGSGTIHLNHVWLR